MLTLCLCTTSFFAQDESEYLEETNFSISSTPAFTMLGVTPEIVTRPGYVRDFKVDWRIKNYNLAPDLALEAQPVWFLYYDRHDLDVYRKATPFQKSLSTLSFSLATAKLDGINHMSTAFKINLYREKDPLLDKELLRKIQRETDWDEYEIHVKLEDLRHQLDFTNDRERKHALRDSITDLKYELKMIRKGQKDKLQQIREDYIAENWNASMLDMAFGRVWTYNNTGLDSLKVQGSGFALWLNGSLCMGKSGQLLGIFKYKKAGFDSMITLGAAYRYGARRFNFYFETVYETAPDYANAFISEDEVFADKVAFDLGTAWLRYDEADMESYLTFSYGGDFLINKNILLNFSLRTKFSTGFDFVQFLPVANLTCLMR